MDSPILITGCTRSGNTVVAGMVELCKAFTGNNSKMRENLRVRDEIIHPYLNSLGVDLLGQYPLPDTNNLKPVVSLKEDIENIFIEEGYKKGKWMLKDPKMGLIWPVWNEAFPNAKWIIVRRKTSDIISSCVKTGFMRAFKDVRNQIKVGGHGEKEAWLWWVHQHLQRFIEMIEAGLNCKVIWPERMVNGDYEQMKEIIEWMGLKWNPECIDFVNSKLWKSKK